MNDRYIDYGELENLPSEAFSQIGNDSESVEFDDIWLKHAAREDQVIAVREWFTDRFCNPAEELPYNSREGGYLYINGGPYSPEEEILQRFENIVSSDVLEEVITELECEVGSEWAPIIKKFEYDELDYYDIYVESRHEPINNLNDLFDNIEALRKNNTISILHQSIVNNMIYGMFISAIEAYLWETVMYWAKEDINILYRLASKECDEKKHKLFEVLLDTDKFRKELIEHFNTRVVWHRVDKLKPIIEYGLGIQLPDISFILKALNVRHDIVHRAGKNKNGVLLRISSDMLDDLKNNILSFVNAVERELMRVNPGKTPERGVQ